MAKKLVDEIRRTEGESSQMILDAESKAKKIIADATLQASKIVEEAKKDAEQKSQEILEKAKADNQQQKDDAEKQAVGICVELQQKLGLNRDKAIAGAIKIIRC